MVCFTYGKDNNCKPESERLRFECCTFTMMMLFIMFVNFIAGGGRSQVGSSARGLLYYIHLIDVENVEM